MPERLIDAIELVRYLCGACPSHQNGECIDKMCWKYEDRARIENAPTIDAEPVKHGRWIQSDALDYKDANGGIHVYGMCSCCRTIYDFRDMTSRFKFCPNCGAKMDAKPEIEVQEDDS